jgi:hypothetical protein
MGFPGLTGDRRGPLEGKWRGPLAGIRAGGFQRCRLTLDVTCR